MKICIRTTLALGLLALSIVRVSAKPNVSALARQCDELRKQKACSDLAKLAERDKDTEVRMEAIRVLSDASVLMHIIESELFPAVRQAAEARLKDIRPSKGGPTGSNAHPTFDDYVSSGTAKLGKYDWKGAAADFANAIPLRPDSPDAYFGRGRAEQSLGLTDFVVRKDERVLNAAIADFTRAIEMKPDYAEAYRERGVAKNYKNDFAGAIPDFTRAIAIKEDFRNAYIGRGAAEMGINDFDAAISDFTALVQAKSDDAFSFYRRAQAKQAKGDVAGANADFAKAREIQPNIDDVFHFKPPGPNSPAITGSRPQSAATLPDTSRVAPPVLPTGFVKMPADVTCSVDQIGIKFGYGPLVRLTCWNVSKGQSTARILSLADDVLATEGSQHSLTTTDFGKWYITGTTGTISIIMDAGKVDPLRRFLE